MKNDDAATVSVSSSRVVGKHEPTAFTCAPRASQRFSTIGSRRCGRRADDLGAEERGVDGRRDGRADLAGELLGGLEPPRPDADLRIVEHRAHRVDVPARLGARAEDRDALRVGRASARVATAETAAVRISVIGAAFMIATQLAGLAVVEQDAAHVRVEAARRVRRARSRSP